ncbi:MAG: type VI secretion system baseplate subunit TssG [Alphaproteobacteria bacterium]
MSSSNGRKNRSIKEHLFEEPFSFEFEKAVQILESLSPLCASIGENYSPNKEALSIKSHIRLSPPSSELHSLSVDENKKVNLWINFLSIAGIQGPLPTPYTEAILQRTHAKDTALRDFIDIFNHRLASLWHRFSKKSRPFSHTH